MPQEGDEYQFPDGTVEVVSAIIDGRVLTVREYSDVEQFRESITDAEKRGTNPLVADLSVDMFANEGQEK